MAARKRKKKPTPPPVVRKPARAQEGSGPGRKELVREAKARAQRREALRRRLAAAGLAVAAVAAVAAYVVVDRSRDAELRQALTSGSCEVDTEADRISGGDGHVPSPRYEVNPPAGGDHLAGSAGSGVYPAARAPEDGLLVHSQEHGYVVVWHEPGLAQEQVEQLEQLHQRHAPDVIVVERPGMPVPVAATAWGQRLLCGQVEVDVLDRFVEAYVGKGPESVERT